jgi:hypothetical protein
MFYDVEEARLFPFLTAIIDVKGGVVQGVAWDDASIFCGKKQVRPNTLDFAGAFVDQKTFKQPADGCYYTKEECLAKAGGCDLLLHVVWTGTDSSDQSFLSSAYRYSAFPPQEWSDRLTGLLPDVDVTPFDGE